MKRLLGFAEFVRRHYQAIILVTVALGLALGVWTTAPGQTLQPYTQALTFLMILFISFTIDVWGRFQRSTLSGGPQAGVEGRSPESSFDSIALRSGGAERRKARPHPSTAQRVLRLHFVLLRMRRCSAQDARAQN